MSALSEWRRSQRETRLVCPACGAVNRPGLTRIVLCDDEVAECRCGYSFVPLMAHLAEGMGFKGRDRD